MLCILTAAEIVNGISWTEALDTVFDDNRHIDPSLSWQYFGSDKGFMRTYPGIISLSVDFKNCLCDKNNYK